MTRTIVNGLALSLYVRSTITNVQELVLLRLRQSSEKYARAIFLTHIGNRNNVNLAAAMMRCFCFKGRTQIDRLPSVACS